MIRKMVSGWQLIAIVSVGIVVVILGGYLGFPSLLADERVRSGAFPRPCNSATATAKAERYGLPPSKAGLAKEISFLSDWELSPTGGWNGIQAVDACRIFPDGSRTWHGKAAARVEVRPGDDPLMLHANTERAEVLAMQDPHGRRLTEAPASGVQYYATSYKFPADWQGQQLPWSAFTDDCTSDGGNRCNSWSFVLQFYGWAALSAAQFRAGGPQIYRFADRTLSRSAIAPGRWTDFIFMVDWATGAYRIWRRDESEQGFELVLEGVHEVKTGSVYVKQGLYRGGHVKGRTDVMWVGPMARGTTFSVVEQAAFQTSAGVH